MATQVSEERVNIPASARTGRSTGGAVLITIGLFLLAAQLLPGREMGLLFLPALGGVFLVAGLVSRNVGLLVPGGVLAGIGTGVYLLEGSVLYSSGMYIDGAAEAGVILMSLAGGFLVVSVLSTMVTGRLHVWPLFPATVLAGIGGLLFSGDEGIRILNFVGHYWPVVLIVFGAALLIRRPSAQ